MLLNKQLIPFQYEVSFRIIDQRKIKSSIQAHIKVHNLQETLTLEKAPREEHRELFNHKGRISS